MSDVAPAPIPEPVQPPSGSQAGRLVRVFYEPGAVFQELARTPRWLMALLVLILIGTVTQLVVSSKIDMEATVRQAIAERAGGANLSEAQIDRQVEVATKFAKVGRFVGVVIVPIALLLIGLAYFLGLKAVGSDASFTQTFATSLHAMLPASVVSGVVGLVVLSQRQSITGTEAQSLVKSSLAALLPPNAPAVLSALAGIVDVFNVWMWVLLVMGLAIVGRVSRGKSVAVVVGVWLLWALIKVGLAALRPGA